MYMHSMYIIISIITYNTFTLCPYHYSIHVHVHVHNMHTNEATQKIEHGLQSTSFNPSLVNPSPRLSLGCNNLVTTMWHGGYNLVTTLAMD